VASKSLAIVFLHIVSLLLTTLVFGRQSERNILPTRTMLSERKVMATRVVRSIMHVRATSSSRCEPDSHADTTVAGKNMCMIEPTGVKVNIAAYSDEVSQLTDIPIATAGTVFDCPTTGASWLLVFHETLFLGARLPNSLICPNQLRDFGVTVHDTPKRYDPNSMHAVYVPEHKLMIPMASDGTISYFDTRLPTEDELHTLPRVQMTSELPWDPKSPHFDVAEKQATLDTPVASVRRTAALSFTSRGYAPIFDAGYHEPRHIHATQKHMLAAELMVAADHKSVPTALLGMGTPVESRECYSIGTIPLATLLPGTPSLASRLSGTNQTGVHGISGVSTSIKQSVLTAKELADKWSIGLEAAAATIRCSTQRGRRTVVNPTRRFRTKSHHFRYKTLPGKWYSDTLIGNVTSVRQYKYAQVTTNGLGYTRFMPMEAKSDASQGIVDFIHNAGIPEWLITDNAKEQHSRQFEDVIRKFHIRHTFTEPHSPWQDRAEIEIKESKKRIRFWTRKKQSPKRLWCYCGVLAAAIRRLTASSNPELNGRSPTEHVTGDTGEISAYTDMEWYDWVEYIDNDGQTKFGRWLGVSETHGGGNVSWILPISCLPIVRSTVWAMPSSSKTEETRAKMEAFTKVVESKLGDSLSDEEIDQAIGDHFPAIDDDIFDGDSALDEVNHAEPEASMPEADEMEDEEAYDKWLTAKVMLPVNGEFMKGTVKSRKRDADGLPLGRHHSNPIADTRMYDVEMADGSTMSYMANTIAESMYSMIDEEGQHYSLIDEIQDHERDDTAIDAADGTFTTATGQTRKKRTTRGWTFLVLWKDGTSDWVPLRDMKETYPLQTANYARGNDIQDEPAFAWWVPTALRIGRRMVAKIAKSAKYWNRTHKYGIEVPKNVADALRIDSETGTDFWRKAIDKEMTNNKIAFEFLDDEAPMPIGYKQMRGHMIFDIKLCLTRKARWVADGSQSEMPRESTYSSVVSRDSVRIFFTLAALNDVEVLACDVQNAYLNAPTKEKNFIIAGKEFGPNEGRRALIVRALYGMASSGARYRAHCAQVLRDMGFTSCHADQDVWMRAATKPDGTEYYEYVLCYVDDILAMSTNPMAIMDALRETYTLKKESVKEPDLYLGADVKKYYISGTDDADKPRWAMSSDKYAKRAIADVESKLKETNRQLMTKAATPLAGAYRPELDQSPFLTAEDQNYYQGLIGILRWLCELGRIDILVPVSLMSRYLVAGRIGHLEQLFHIFAYIKHHSRSSMVFDDNEPHYDPTRFIKADWSDFYPDAKEEYPANAPPLRGRPVVTSCFEDADHAGCRDTRRSHTGIIIFVNRAPILWFSKRQSTVESSTFSSELVAARIATEMIKGLRVKLRMMGVEVIGPTSMFCDNDSVVMQSTRPESALKKKHQILAYHLVREAQASNIISVSKESGKTNLADIATKLCTGPVLRELSSHLLW
jgi:hypothetical protein